MALENSASQLSIKDLIINAAKLFLENFKSIFLKIILFLICAFVAADILAFVFKKLFSYNLHDMIEVLQWLLKAFSALTAAWSTAFLILNPEKAANLTAILKDRPNVKIKMRAIDQEGNASDPVSVELVSKERKYEIQVKPDSDFIVGYDPVTGRNQDIAFTWEQLCLASEYQVAVFTGVDGTKGLLISIAKYQFCLVCTDFNPKKFPVGDHLFHNFR